MRTVMILIVGIVFVFTGTILLDSDSGYFATSFACIGLGGMIIATAHIMLDGR